jgi:hypothetical protein
VTSGGLPTITALSLAVLRKRVEERLIGEVSPAPILLRLPLHRSHAGFASRSHTRVTHLSPNEFAAVSMPSLDPRRNP